MTSTIAAEDTIGGWRIIVSRNGVPHLLFCPPPTDRYPGWTRIASIDAPLGSVRPGCLPVAHGVPLNVEERGMQMLRDFEATIVHVGAGETGVRASDVEEPIRIDQMIVTGPGSLGIDLD